MLVHRKKRPRYLIQAPLTSLIDIIFMLLIYFMLTTNFIVDEGISVKLPRAKASAPVKTQDITIYVDARGKAFLFEREMTETQLFTELKKKMADDKQTRVTVKADRSVMLNRAVKVMDIAKAAGATTLALATERDGLP